jgi:hypothetical protein
MSGETITVSGARCETWKRPLPGFWKGWWHNELALSYLSLIDSVSASPIGSTAVLWTHSPSSCQLSWANVRIPSPSRGLGFPTRFFPVLIFRIAVWGRTPLLLFGCRSRGSDTKNRNIQSISGIGHNLGWVSEKYELQRYDIWYAPQDQSVACFRIPVPSCLPAQKISLVDKITRCSLLKVHISTKNIVHATPRKLSLLRTLGGKHTGTNGSWMLN